MLFHAKEASTQQAAFIQDAPAAFAMHGFPCDNAEFSEAARLAAAQHRFKQANLCSSCEVPLCSETLGAVDSVSQVLQARPPIGCHRSSVVPVDCSSTALDSHMRSSGNTQPPPGSCFASYLLEAVKQQAEVVLSDLSHDKSATPSIVPSGVDQELATAYCGDKQLALVAPEAEQNEDVDFLSAVQVNTPLCTALRLREEDLQRTMRICEGLTVNLLHDLGDTRQGVRSSPLCCPAGCCGGILPETSHTRPLVQVLRHQKVCMYRRATDFITAISFLPSSLSADGEHRASPAAQPGSAAELLQSMHKARSCCNQLASELSEFTQVRAVGYVNVSAALIEAPESGVELIAGRTHVLVCRSCQHNIAR